MIPQCSLLDYIILSRASFFKIGKWFFESEMNRTSVLKKQVLGTAFRLGQFWMYFVRISNRTSAHLRVAKVFQTDLESFRWSASIPLGSHLKTDWLPVRNH